MTSITWKLLPDLKWSDGTAVTADDAVFTWQYCTHPEGGCSQATKYEGIASVEAVDPSTIKVTFNGPKANPYTAFVVGPVAGPAEGAVRSLPWRRCADLHRPEQHADRHRPVQGDRLHGERHRDHGNERKLP